MRRDTVLLMSRSLTPAEARVLEMVGRGLPNAAIARELHVTEQTIKFHLTNTYRKLGVTNRTEAALWLRGNVSA